MAKFCPITNDMVLYLDCLECETKECNEKEATGLKEKNRKPDEDKEK